MTNTPRHIQIDQIDIWVYPLDAHIEGLTDTSALHDSALSPDEIARAARLRIPAQQRQFIAARQALRQTLSVYTHTPPAEITFAYGTDGKPYLPQHPAIHFNLSHTAQRALIAVAKSPVGIDIERIRPLPNWREMAKIAFSADEQAALESAPHHTRDALFFRMWTRKEALMKARGEGFKLAHQLNIPVSVADSAIVIDGWKIEDVPIDAGFIAAVATQI